MNQGLDYRRLCKESTPLYVSKQPVAGLQLDWVGLRSILDISGVKYGFCKKFSWGSRVSWRQKSQGHWLPMAGVVPSLVLHFVAYPGRGSVTAHDSYRDVQGES